MEINENSTKQKIKETALDLFSQKGFTAVSIRNISGKVGIKESTIYYYFKNKQDIYDNLILDFKAITSTIQENFDHEFSKATQVDKPSFILVGITFLNKYLLNEKILKLLRMLMIEQHVNSCAAALFRQVMFDDPLRQNEMVFELMITKGYFKKHDTKAMAVEYYAPIFLTFLRYFSTNDVTETSVNEANAIVTTHLSNFYEQYSIGERKGDSYESLQK